MEKIQFDLVSWNYQEKSKWHSTIHQSQSPINIVKNELQTLIKSGTIDINYANKLDALIDTSYCVRGHVKGVTTINKESHSLQQFHFHTLGEHQIDGKSFPLELHLLHQSKKGDLVVIAVLFKIGN